MKKLNIQPLIIQVNNQVRDAQRFPCSPFLFIHLSTSVQSKPGFGAPGWAVAPHPLLHRTGGSQFCCQGTWVSGWQFSGAVPSFPYWAMALQASFTWTRRSKRWTAWESQNSPGVSDRAHVSYGYSIYRAISSSSEWTWGASTILSWADARNSNSITSVRTLVFLCSINLSRWCTYCFGTVGLSLFCP